MNVQLIQHLQHYWFSDKEAKVYLTVLELSSSSASAIARRSDVKRTTTYSILEDLKNRGIVTEIIRNDIKYYSAISPEVLFKKQEEKYEIIKSQLPELLAISNKFWNRPRTHFFEWFQWLKQVFEEVLEAGKSMKEPYLSFVWADKMDPKVATYIYDEFLPKRKKYKTKTKAIISKDNSAYGEYHKKSHTSVFVDKPLFNFGNEIVVFGGNKVAILMYATDEMSGLIIESTTLHDWLASLFDLIRNVYKTKK